MTITTAEEHDTLGDIQAYVSVSVGDLLLVCASRFYKEAPFSGVPSDYTYADTDANPSTYEALDSGGGFGQTVLFSVRVQSDNALLLITVDDVDWSSGSVNDRYLIVANMGPLDQGVTQVALSIGDYEDGSGTVRNKRMLSSAAFNVAISEVLTFVTCPFSPYSVVSLTGDSVEANLDDFRLFYRHTTVPATEVSQVLVDPDGGGVSLSCIAVVVSQPLTRLAGMTKQAILRPGSGQDEQNPIGQSGPPGVGPPGVATNRPLKATLGYVVLRGSVLIAAASQSNWDNATLSIASPDEYGNTWTAHAQSTGASCVARFFTCTVTHLPDDGIPFTVTLAVSGSPASLNIYQPTVLAVEEVIIPGEPTNYTAFGHNSAVGVDDEVTYETIEAVAVPRNTLLFCFAAYGVTQSPVLTWSPLNGFETQAEWTWAIPPGFTSITNDPRLGPGVLMDQVAEGGDVTGSAVATLVGGGVLSVLGVIIMLAIESASLLPEYIRRRYL